jgi:hypothetical protein
MYMTMGRVKHVQKLGAEMSATLTGHWGVFGRHEAKLASQLLLAGH